MTILRKKSEYVLVLVQQLVKNLTLFTKDIIMFANCNFMLSIKKNISNLSIVAVFVFYPSFSKGQNPIFRQMYTQRYLTNPSLVGNGSIDGLGIERISSGIKAQWMSLESRLYTQSLSYDAPIKANNSSWGIGAFMTDLNSGSVEQSKYSHFSGTLSYAYNIPIKKMNIKFGLSAQFSSITFGRNNFMWEDQINESMTGFVKPTQEPLNQLTKNVIHASAGALIYGKKGFFGLAVHNVNEPNISFFEDKNQTIERKFLVHGGLVFDKIFNHAVLTPNFAYSKQGNVQSALISTNVKLDNLQLSVGTQYVTAFKYSAWSITNYLGYRYDKYFIGYSADLNLSINYGSIPIIHEFSVLILLNKKDKKLIPHPFPEM
jgi:type IX secretion system PorP/SprF family membrane protein